MKKTVWFLDVDGCLTAGKFARFNLAAMQRLEQLVREQGLEVVLCTGRSLSYLEALAQVLRLGRYAIGDHGAVLYDLERDEAFFHPKFDRADRDKLRQLRYDLERLGQENGKWKLSHGKEASVSLVGQGCDALMMHEILQKEFDCEGFDLHASGRVLDLVSTGINKWVGAQFHLHKQYLSLDGLTIAAIGDSHGDLPLLSQAHIATCPANGHKQVQAVCDYVSPQPDILGVIDILSQPLVP